MDGLESAVLYARIRRQQLVYRWCLAGAGLALLMALPLLWAGRPAPRHQALGTFDLDVWLIPLEQKVFRVTPCGQPGTLLFLDERGWEGDLRQLDITPYALRGKQFTAGEPFTVGVPRGSWPDFGYPDGRCLVSPAEYYPQPDGRREERWRLSDYSASGGGSRLPLALYKPLLKTNAEGALLIRQQFVALDPVTQGGDSWSVVVSKAGLPGRTVQTLRDVALRGNAWHAGSLTHAVVGKDGRVLQYDPGRGRFVERKGYAKLGQALLKAGAVGNQFVLADGFGAAYASYSWALADTAGNIQTIKEIAPYSHYPDGRRKPDLLVIAQGVSDMREVGDGPDSGARMVEQMERQRRQSAKQGPRVPPGLVGTMPSLRLVDERTIALIDGFYYQRVVLVTQQAAAAGAAPAGGAAAPPAVK